MQYGYAHSHFGVSGIGSHLEMMKADRRLYRDWVPAPLHFMRDLDSLWVLVSEGIQG